MTVGRRAPLVPKLRFPEFREAPEWSATRGDALFAAINNRRAAPDLPVLAITQERGAIPRDQIDYHVSVTAESVASYKEVCEGDFIISLRSFQGGIEYSRYHGICSPAYVILRRKGNGSDHYFRHLFKAQRFIQQLTRNIEGIRDGKMISYAQFSEQLLPVPEPPEQQKIADCLGSLDDLIAAEGRKLEVLRNHKQGLMQQLFPQPGETIPSLRFPEFQDAREWAPTTIGEHVDLLAGFPFDGKDIVDDRAGTPLMRGINVTEGRIRHHSEIDRYFLGPTEDLEKYTLREGDLVIGMDGSKVGRNSALVPATDAGALLVQRVARLRSDQQVTIDFIFHHVNSRRFHAYVDRINTSSGIPHISAKQIMEFSFSLPATAEQQRISDCLFSLDLQLGAQDQKLHALKRHKRGLLQQLFPSVEEESR